MRQGTSLGDVDRQVGVELDQSGSQDPIVGFGEQHRDSAAAVGGLVAAGVADAFDDAFASESS